MIMKGKNIFGFVLTCLLFITTIVITGVNFKNTSIKSPQPPTLQRLRFAYDVYCPINSASSLKILNQWLKSVGEPDIPFNYNINTNTYFVINHAFGNKEYLSTLSYCGLARTWTEKDCSNARVVCSAPGPTFYFAVKEAANIIWINNLKLKNDDKWVQADCFANGAQCQVEMKKNDGEQCTFFKPTDFVVNMFDRHVITKEYIPISPHIHGLEIRPLFDGNPLGWFNAKGDHGPGYSSLLNNQKYFSMFFSEATLKGNQNFGVDYSKRMKIIRVTNDQSPGLYFYHDHAMKSTKINVENGLSGLYIIYDPAAEADLPKGDNERFILFSKATDNDARDNNKIIINGVLKEEDTYNRNQLYRFRFLNAHFDNAYLKVEFVYYSSKRQVNDQTEDQPINPENSAYDLEKNKNSLPFSIIGADTSLFHIPIHSQTHFDMGPAERVDTIIRFGENLPANITDVYLICYDNNLGKTAIKYKFKISNSTVNTIRNPGDIKSLNVPFFNLSTYGSDKITTTRHRALIDFPKDGIFNIGMHYMYGMGASENSKIGTIEDFYISNNLWEGHPLHFHLVNFQVVKSYSLKKILGPNVDQQCTLYILDYFRASNLPQFQGKTNSDLCSQLWGLSVEEAKAIYEQLSNFDLEDSSRVTPNGRVSGAIDIMQTYDGTNPALSAYVQAECALSLTHKYVCADTTDAALMPHEKRWKDTTYIDPYSVFVVRVRWASNSYSDPTMQSYPYFPIDESHLIEFPGFLYHCHILPHEDNEMMRPIMLEHSDEYNRRFSNGLFGAAIANYCDKLTWTLSMQCLNTATQC